MNSFYELSFQLIFLIEQHPDGDHPLVTGAVPDDQGQDGRREHQGREHAGHTAEDQGGGLSPLGHLHWTGDSQVLSEASWGSTQGQAARLKQIERVEVID